MLAGPDFFNARLAIDNQAWAGNVEIHINSSDWYAHHHEQDNNYDTVILHVVWEDDVSIFRKDGSLIPTLELKNYVSQELLINYMELFSNKKEQFINCGKNINTISPFLWDNWIERLYFERLERKSEVILELLEMSRNDWEKVLFLLLLKNFGSKINGEIFFQLGKNTDFSIIRKLQSEPTRMESLLLGQAKLLESDEIVDPYFLELKQEYAFLKLKYGLDASILGPPAFFRLRPSNFPTIRLSQIAALYASNSNLFHHLIEAENPDFHQIFKVHINPYWQNHYTFGRQSKKTSKFISKSFMDLIVINTILPLKFCYAKHKGLEVGEAFFGIIKDIKKEDNSIIRNYESLGVSIDSAMDSQAMLQLYGNYCREKKCLQCAVGSELLNLKP